MVYCAKFFGKKLVEKITFAAGDKKGISHEWRARVFWQTTNYTASH